MMWKRPPSPSPDLGSLTSVLEGNTGDRRGVQIGLAVAAALHAVIFATTWPSFAGGERTVATAKPDIFVVKLYEFEPPDPARIQMPEPPRRTIVIPDPDPEAPEPELRRDTTEIPSLDETEWVPFTVPVPPPEEAEDEILTVGVNVEAPRIVVKVDPRYPEPARAARKQGAVVLELLIDEWGEVAEVTVLRGLPLGLTESAVEAARQWRFEPSTLRGRPVAVRYNLTVQFRLE